jgi:hypothetical protein
MSGRTGLARPASPVSGEPGLSQQDSSITRAITRLLTPLVRVLLRHGVSLGLFNDLAKRIYVRVAEDEFPLAGRKQTTARVAVLTGLPRKEVAQLRTESMPAADDVFDARHNRAARVISGWMHDADFKDASGEAATLPLEGESGFEALVRRYSGDIPARTVLDELVRVGTVETCEDGSVRLLQRGYIPDADTEQKLHILGTDTRDLIATIDHNLNHGDQPPRFQRKVVYDNVPEEFVQAFSHLVTERGETLLAEFDQWLAQRDRDRTPGVGGTGRVRLGLAIHMIEDHAPESSEPPEGES